MFKTKNSFSEGILVSYVLITNRGDCCSERAHNVRVGVMDYPPTAGSDVDPDSYTLCMQKDGMLP